MKETIPIITNKMMNTNMLHNIIFKDFDMAYPHFERLYRGCDRSPHFKYSRYNGEKCAVSRYQNKNLRALPQVFSVLRSVEFNMLIITIEPSSECPIDPASVPFVIEGPVFEDPDSASNAVING